jgi:hypothetical protein
MPKQYVSYRKPRRISEDVKEHRRIQMKNINKSQLRLNIGRKKNIIGSRDFLPTAENISQNNK